MGNCPTDWGTAAGAWLSGRPVRSGGESEWARGVRSLKPDKVFLLAGHLSLPEQQVPAEGEEQHLLLL